MTFTARDKNPTVKENWTYQQVFNRQVKQDLIDIETELASISGGGGSGANTGLSNLTTTSINQNLIPQSSKTLGDSSNRWSGLWSTTGNFSGDLNVDSGVFFVDTTNNRIGVNNASPAFAVDVLGNVNIVGQIAVRRISGNPTITNLAYSNSAFDGANYMCQRARGTSITSFSAVQSGDVLGALQAIGANEANSYGSVSAQIQIITTENHSGTAAGTRISFEVTANTTTTRTTRAIIDQNGSFTVGSSSGTGSGAFYAGSGTFTGNLTIDTDTFFVDSTNNRVGVLTTSTISGAHLTVGNGGAVSTNSIVAINGGSSGQSAVYFYQNSVLKGINGSASGTNSIINGTALGDFAIRNSQAIFLSVDSGTTANFVINSSGNFSLGTGTFISGIRATLGNGSNGSQNEVLALNGSLTGITGTYYYQNGTVKALFGIAGASNHLITGSVQSDFNIRNSQAILFSADGGTTAHMKLLSTGDFWIDTNVLYVSAVNNRVGVKTSSPSYDLHVSGTSGFTSTMTLTSGQNIVSSASSNSFLTPDDGSGNALFASRSSLIFHFDYDNNQTDAVAKFRVNNVSDIWYINENGSVTQDYLGTTGRALNLNASSITTDGILRVYSNSGDTSSRYMVNVINDHASANGSIPFRIQQDANVNTNFKIVAEFAGKLVYVSDGTDPNGLSLTGATQGSICLNAGANGEIKRYSTGTTWT